MEEILSLKFDQHRDLRDQLINTGSAELVEVRRNVHPFRLRILTNST